MGGWWLSMPLKKPVRSVSLLNDCLIRVHAIYIYFAIQLKTRFATIFNNFYNLISLDTPFTYDVLHISSLPNL